MIFSDRDIKKLIKEKRLLFKPGLKNNSIGPASIDLCLGNVFKTFKKERQSLIDIKSILPKDYMKSYKLKKGERFILHPNDFVLAATREYIKLSGDLVARVEGKSTLARMGILVHTAGYIDPGFEGTITLEISNQSNMAVTLYPGMYICQIAIYNLSSPAEVPYNKRKKSLYSKSSGVVEAKTKNLF